MNLKKNILIAGLLCAFGVVGASSLALSTNFDSKVAKADQTLTDSTIEIRFTRPSDWGDNTVCIHTWNEGGDGTDWPGYAMDYLWDNAYGQSVWTWSPSASDPLYGNIIFNNNGNGMQSDTLAAPATSKAYWYDNGWQSGDLDAETMDIYLYDYDNRFGETTVKAHAWRDGTDFFNDAEPGVAMNKLTSVATNGLIYKVTISNICNRVYFSNSDGSDKTGDLTPTGNYCYVLANNETELSGKNTWWNNFNYVLAHNFSQNTMLMRSLSTSDESETAYCATRYAAAKAAINAFSTSSYLEYVLPELNSNFSAAVTRLQAWATANGETFNSTTGAFSPSNVPLTILMGTGSNSAVLIIITISVVALASAGFFFIRRRKLEK